jgi:hypothetical protein
VLTKTVLFTKASQACGDWLYGDFREADDGSLERLEAMLRQHAGPAASQQAVNRSLGTYAASRQTTRRGNAGPGWTAPGSSNQRESNEPSDLHTGSKNQETSPPPVNEALQLCVETGRHSVELGTLDVEPAQSDGDLFRRLREQYKSVRSSALPIAFRFKKPDKVIYVKVGPQPYKRPSNTISSAYTNHPTSTYVRALPKSTPSPPRPK